MSDLYHTTMSEVVMAGPTPVEVTRDVFIKCLCEQVRYTALLSQLLVGGLDQQFASRLASSVHSVGGGGGGAPFRK